MDAPNDPGFEHAPVGLAVTRNRLIGRCNSRFCEMFGYPRATLEGSSLARLYPSCEIFERIGRLGLETMRRSGRYTDERIMRHCDGHLFWCRVRGQSLTPEDPFAQAVWSFAPLLSERPVVEDGGSTNGFTETCADLA